MFSHIQSFIVLFLFSLAFTAESFEYDTSRAIYDIQSLTFEYSPIDGSIASAGIVFFIGIFILFIIVFFLSIIYCCKSKNFNKKIRKLKFDIMLSKNLEPGETAPRSPRSSRVASSSDLMKIKSQKTSISIAYLNFWYEGKNKERKQIIYDYCVSFLPGTLTAMMGPSGCGKTTLLGLISGRRNQGTFSGVRAINGISYPNTDYRLMMAKQGYVKQDDSFFADLTVAESLAYVAKLKLPKEQSTNDLILQRVEQVIKEVGLEKVATNKIGDGPQNGLSGGQRRRLSIAQELISLPSVLILDEPTSGLDSTSSLKLIQLLQHLARSSQRTIITTIHQPRSDIMNLFDRLLLMSSAGTMVYYGSLTHAEKFLANNSKLQPEEYPNIGDYIIDVLGLDPEKPGFGHDIQLSAAYSNSKHFQNLVKEINGTLRRTENHQLQVGSAPRKNEYPASFWRAVGVFFGRRYTRITGVKRAMLKLYIQLTVVALVLVSSFSYTLAADELLMKPYQNFSLCVIMTAYIMITQYLILVPEYFEERETMKQERQGAVHGLWSYMVGTTLTEAPRAILHSVFFYIVWQIFSSSMNTNSIYPFTMVFTFIFGVSAWQSCVAICCAITDSIDLSYALLFFLFGVGSLYGGTILAFEHIPGVFKFLFYWTSVPAVTTRGMLCNELYDNPKLIVPCIFIEQNIKNVASPLKSMLPSNDTLSSFCPPHPDEWPPVPDPNAVIDTGKLALSFLGFPYLEIVSPVFVLLLVQISCRILSVYAFKWREKKRMNLKETGFMDASDRINNTASIAMPSKEAINIRYLPYKSHNWFVQLFHGPRSKLQY